jgi:hypothetical protein
MTSSSPVAISGEVRDRGVALDGDLGWGWDRTSREGWRWGGGQACGRPPYSFNLTRAPPERRDAAVRGLRDWLGKQRFKPQVMTELVDLIKRPMDRYAVGARGGDDDAPDRTRRAPWSATVASCWRGSTARSSTPMTW